MKTIIRLATALIFASMLVPALGQDAPYKVDLATNPKSITTGHNTSIDVYVSDRATGHPIKGMKFSIGMSMPSMSGMTIKNPTVVEGGVAGHYTIIADFPMPGDYLIRLTAGNMTYGVQVHATLPSDDKPMKGMDEMGGMSGMQMKGSLGEWSMSREGSGTSWMPDSSPMYMRMLPKSGRYDLDLMGMIQAGYVDAGGKRGDQQLYANSMLMWMGRRETGRGVIGADLMLSLDPLSNGKRGVPNLFQTGETDNGQPLVDRQHPHDFIAEAAASFSKLINKNDRIFFYGAPIGEPALGGPMFMHRASGMEIPEAPITHHWFDSTHISFGVATLGLTIQDKWKFEASAFNGHEPDENRYAIDPIGLNSYAGRVTFNPSSDWSLSASYGFLSSPEALEPGVNQHRITASAMYDKAFANGDNLASTLYFGRLIVAGSKDSNAYALETTYTHDRDSIFERLENVDKDELVGVPAGSYKINKLLLGDVHNFSERDGFEYGLGAYVGVYSFPKGLDSFYGSHPRTWGIFLRIRPTKM